MKIDLKNTNKPGLLRQNNLSNFKSKHDKKLSIW